MRMRPLAVGMAIAALGGLAAAVAIGEPAPSTVNAGDTVLSSKDYPNATPTTVLPGESAAAAAEFAAAHKAVTQSQTATSNSNLPVNVGDAVIGSHDYPDASPENPPPGTPPAVAAEMKADWELAHPAASGNSG